MSTSTKSYTGSRALGIPLPAYPMLHGMERKGYLKSHKTREGRTYRRFYRATPLGRKALALVRTRLNELFDEVAKKRRKRAKQTKQSREVRTGDGIEFR